MDKGPLRAQPSVNKPRLFFSVLVCSGNPSSFFSHLYIEKKKNNKKSFFDKILILESRIVSVENFRNETYFLSFGKSVTCSSFIFF